MEDLRQKACGSKSETKINDETDKLQKDLFLSSDEDEMSNDKEIHQEKKFEDGEDEEKNEGDVPLINYYDLLMDSDDSSMDPDYIPAADPEAPDTSDDELSDSEQAVSEVLSGIITRVVKLESKNIKKTRAERQKNKKLRNLGKSYISQSGKLVKGRELTDLTPCRMKCNERLNIDKRRTLFNEYWELGSRDQRANFVSSHITLTNTKTIKVNPTNKNRIISCSYHFNINNEKHPVCKKCFCMTLGETRGFIEVVIKQKHLSPCSITALDKRGRGSSGNQRSEAEIKDVKDHIASFPSYESHYCRQTSSKNYLSSDLNITKMYKLYAETRQNPVSINFYAKCFHSLNMCFKKPKKDTCNTCDLFQAQIMVSTNIEDKAAIIEKRDAHHEMAESAYSSKKEDKEKAKINPKHRVFTFDLQQCLPTPFLTTSVAFYKRQLWTFNLTIHDLADDTSYCYMWDESISGRGANQIASCLFEQLKTLPPDTEEVTFYSDTCGGQNKNNIVAIMFLYAVQKLSIKEVNHKFLVSGHTHMECDSDHAIIERAKKHTGMKINHLNDWVQLVRSCRQKKPFTVVQMTKEKLLDFTSLTKKGGPFVIKKQDTENAKFLWKPVQWLQYRKSSNSLFFKHKLDTATIFKTINFTRRGKPNIINHQIPLINSGPNPISAEKKKDIISLLPLIDPIFHDFYRNLITNNKPPIDPDLIEVEEDDI